CCSALDFRLEFQPQSAELPFVVFNCCEVFLFGLLLEDDGFHEYFSRTSANTSAAGLPTARPAWISAMRRRASACHAKVTSSSASSSSVCRRKYAKSA